MRLAFPAKSVGRSFAIEAGYVALQGTVIGVVLALLTLYTIVARSDAMGDLSFAVPYTVAGDPPARNDGRFAPGDGGTGFVGNPDPAGRRAADDQLEYLCHWCGSVCETLTVPGTSGG